MTWNIGLDAWIIQDGNYPDFETGQTAEFAVEFWIAPGATIEATDAPVSATFIEDCRYRAIADVVLPGPDVVVLDVGIQVYRERTLLPPFPPANRVVMDLGIGVDPFMYAAGLPHTPRLPPLVYTWRIQAILLEGKGIDQTRAGHDSGDYTLQCELLQVPPKRTSATYQ